MEPLVLLIAWAWGAVSLASGHSIIAAVAYVAAIGFCIGLRRWERRWD